jgi:hypothetical protein
MNESWAENNQQALHYSPSFLRSCLEYPGTAYSLCPTIYGGEKPIGFVAAFPRTVKFEGKQLRLALITFLTVAPEFKKKGYGVMLWSELVSRARAAGFDGMVNYCIAESDMDKIIVGCCNRLKLPTSCAYSIGYISALLPPAEAGLDLLPRQNDYAIDAFSRVATDVAETAALSRVWCEKEAEWQCRDRLGALISTYSKANQHGALTGYVAPIANEKRTKCVFVEDVLWAELDESARQALMQDLLAKARALGAEMATVPRCGYADLKTFTSAGFVRTRRVARAYLTVWNGPAPRANVPSYYLDVF